MKHTLTVHEAVSIRPPNVGLADVARHVSNEYELVGEYLSLISERDQNFHLKTADGDQYVVKVTSSAEPPEFSDFQLAMLAYLEPHCPVRTPHVVRTINGELSSHIEDDGKSCVLRVVSYLSGKQLAVTTLDSDVASDFGAKLASLDIALRGFSHAGESPELLWDLQRVVELRALSQHIDDAAVTLSVATAIDDFEVLVAPQLNFLRSQVIHSDANPENVLVDESGRSVTGFIDFSDSVKAPVIFDVAISAAYLRATGDDALALIAPFVAAYDAVLPLEEAELGMLFDLVRARLATTITLLYWRLAAREENDSYREKTLQSEGDAARFLNALDDLGRDAFLARLKRELGQR
jgi:Ser/Thr protein kinase RdoA (MazF antagonist)